MHNLPSLLDALKLVLHLVSHLLVVLTVPRDHLGDTRLRLHDLPLLIQVLIVLPRKGKRERVMMVYMSSMPFDFLTLSMILLFR